MMRTAMLLTLAALTVTVLAAPAQADVIVPWTCESVGPVSACATVGVGDDCTHGGGRITDRSIFFFYVLC